MDTKLTIGEFAALTQLSVRTLRRYHQARLLEPETVDALSGYRYYAVGQIPTAQVIHRLRELDLPLAEVKAIRGAVRPMKCAGGTTPPWPSWTRPSRPPSGPVRRAAATRTSCHLRPPGCLGN